MVNINLFWERVKSSIILRKGIKQILPLWSGYMNTNNTNEGNIISSEGSKGKKCSIDIEDSSMICEEDVLAAINETNIPHLRTVLQQEFRIKIHQLTSKNELKREVQTRMQGDFAFRKCLFALYSGSGGYLSLLYPHGIAYAVKWLVKPEE